MITEIKGGQTSSFLLWGTEVNLARSKETAPNEKEMEEMEQRLLNPTHGYFETSSGEKMHYIKYLPEGGNKLKGILVFQHGIGGWCGKTWIPQLVQMTRENGFALYAPDMIGHGFSEGVRFYIPEAGRWEINRDGLEAFTKFASSEHEEGTPLFLAGESYGGCLAIHVARMWQNNPDQGPAAFGGICLVAPAIIGDLPPAPVVFALRKLSYFFPRWRPFFMPNPVSPDRIWKDEDVRKFYTSERVLSMGLHHGGQAFRLGTAAGLLGALEAVRQVAIPGLTIPFAVAHGTSDHAVPITGTDYLLEHADTPEDNKAVRRVEGGYHDILSEETGEQTMRFLMNWINNRVSSM